MAIVQISRITNRKGSQESLPQLAGAELGWAVDSRRLFIGNGTLAEGAPIIGNTEILTEFSDITVLSSYTYDDVAVGYSAQTGVTPGSPVVRTLQQRLDDYVSVRSYGAVGDGVADDTAAINRALFDLYCREINTQIRRSLFFPAGTYIINESLLIPTYAKLIGEGMNSTTIVLDTSGDISTLSAYVARFCDSLQQIGANIGTNGATPPRNIEISGMTFQSNQETDVFLIDQAQECWFDSVGFVGPVSQSELVIAGSTPLPEIALLRLNGTTGNPVNDITFDRCAFSNMTYGFNTTTKAKSVTISNSKFNLLYKGVVLPSGDPSGFRVLHNMFDNIYAEGIEYGDVNINSTGYNAFYNVGNAIGSATPVTPVISFGNDTSVSINDLFERTDADAYIFPRVSIIVGGTPSGGTQIQLGRYARESGRTFSLLDNQVSSQTIFSINNDNVKAFAVDYTIQRGPTVRNGRLIVTSGPDDSTGATAFSDEFTENFTTGITLTVTQSASQASVKYFSTGIGEPGILTYSVSHLA